MESLVIWTLVAVAIVSALVWLIAYKQKTNGQDNQIESLPATVQSDAVPVEPQPSLGTNDENRNSVAVESSSEQVRSYEIALATLQCEIEALRAENSWLKRESLAGQATSRDLITRDGENGFPPALDQDLGRFTDYRGKWASPKSGLIFPAIVVVCSIAVLSEYYARDKTTTVRARIIEAQSQADLPIADTKPMGNPGIKPANVKSDLDPTTNRTTDTSAAKNSRTAPAGRFYKVVRHARVHSQPNESSRPVAEIKPGMEIKVVAARGAWLQVRSLYGRPPGFIRKETAVSKAVG